MFIIGLTGTIGSGKSTVAGMLAELGADVIDTDEIAREVVRPGAPGLLAIVETWGPEVLAADGTLDRDRLAEIVFDDGKQLLRLNGILHSLIGLETQKRITKSKAEVVVLVVPLLFESGMDRIVQQRWVVFADENTLVYRICGRDGCSPDHARRRIESQMSQDEKKARADVAIDNGGSIENTRGQIEEAWRELEKL
jgi:dephospho-CoA kinase